jgi:hypothetical protein
MYHAALPAAPCLIRALPAMLLLLAACRPAPHPTEGPAGAGTAAAGVGGVDLDDPAACRTCHGAIVEAWETSQHARAHHSRDPIFAAMRTRRMAVEGDGLARACGQCHGPRDTAEPESAVAATGVSCATCHAVADVGTEGHGAQRLTWTTGSTLLGPHDLAPGASPAHGTGPSPPHMQDGSQLCLSCHGVMTNPHGVATCTTGSEFAEADTGGSCVGCHMPWVEAPSGVVSSRARHRSHAFAGPHHAARNLDPALARTALSLATGVLEGAMLHVSLSHQSAHAWPSGFPGRMGVVQIRGFDADGAPVWEVDAGAPTPSPPGLRLGRFFEDADGQPVAAAFAQRETADTRMAAASHRLWSQSIPGTVTALEVSVVHHLLPPPAMASMGLADSADHAPLPIHHHRLERTADGWREAGGAH